MDIEIRDLNDETMAAYLCCGTQPTKEKVAAEVEKREWTERMMSKGLGVKVAFCDGHPAGFVNYLPVEVAPAPVEGQGCLFILCIHVNDGDDETKVNYERRGVGKSLVNAVAEYARAHGFTGLTTIGTEGHMPGSFYEHLGFEVADHHEGFLLMWQPFGNGPAPSLMKTTLESSCAPDAVHMDYVYCSFCNCRTHVNSVAEEFGARVIFHEHCIDDRQVMDFQCGANIGAVFIDGERAANPPIGADDWRRRIKEALQRKSQHDGDNEQHLAVNDENAAAAS